MTPPKHSNSSGQNAGGWSVLGGRAVVNSALIVSVAAAVLSCVVILMGATSLLATLFGPGMGKLQPKAELDKLVAEHDKQIDVWQKRFNGRSIFFKPSPPPRQVTRVEAPPPPPPPPQPKDPEIDPVYRGPSIAFAFAESVYFNPPTVGEKYLRIRIGEEKSGIRVIETSLPWSVKVGYKGGTYDVAIFSHTDQSAFLQPATTSAPRRIIATPLIIPVEEHAPSAPVADPQPTLQVEKTDKAAPSATAQPDPSRHRAERNGRRPGRASANRGANHDPAIEEQPSTDDAAADEQDNADDEAATQAEESKGEEKPAPQPGL